MLISLRTDLSPNFFFIQLNSWGGGGCFSVVMCELKLMRFKFMALPDAHLRKVETSFAIWLTDAGVPRKN